MLMIILTIFPMYKYVPIKIKYKQMKKYFITLCLTLLCISKMQYAQNVGINATGAAPNASAILDVVSQQTRDF
jgi:hypothetical protein